MLTTDTTDSDRKNSLSSIAASIDQRVSDLSSELLSEACAIPQLSRMINERPFVKQILINSIADGSISKCDLEKDVSNFIDVVNEGDRVSDLFESSREIRRGRVPKEVENIREELSTS